MRVQRADAAEIRRHAPELAQILRDAVEEGAGLGFVPPLAPTEARAYFERVADEVEKGSRILLLATLDGRVAGSVQLDLCLRPNGRHRAELQKVMVHPAFRRQGVGRALMLATEETARSEGRTTLFLDTFAHQSARALYESCGWTHAGDIPEYALTEKGDLGATSLYYRLLRAG